MQVVDQSHRAEQSAVDAYREMKWSAPAVNRRQAAKRREAPAGPVKIAAAPMPKAKLKVAAYCRVSTLLGSQETSIESQHEHYEQEIFGNDEWELAGIYLEAGVSGTKTEVRPELQKLIADCRAGKIDLILTKSISRFARNTQDCLEMVRTLTALGVTIRFEKEEIDTGTMDSEFMLAILACFAEDESHSISGNMKWGIRKRFRNGTYKQPVAPYGYEWKDDELVIVPEQAVLIKDIFRMALSGLGCRLIADDLNGRKIPSPRGKRWSQGTIRQMIKNPVYKGDTLFQKTYMDEHFKQQRNNGELDQYYNEDHHEAIISREDFYNAQAAMAQRAREVGYDEDSQRDRGSNRYCFTGILTCKACGSVMYRQKSGGKHQAVTWTCRRHAAHPDLCRMKPQNEDDLKAAFINCMNKLAWTQKQNPDEQILDVYGRMLGKKEAEKSADRLAGIEAQLEENRREFRKLSAIIMRDRFLPEHREKKACLTAEARALMTEKNHILISGAPAGTIRQMKTFINGWKTTDSIEDFPEESLAKFVESCTVNSQKMVTFHFRCGLELTESLCRTEVE